MNMRQPIGVAALALALTLGTAPAWGVSKEMVQLQTSVDNLQKQVALMQQSLDQNIGIIKNLTNQNTDTINRMSTALGNMQTALQKQEGDSNARVDQVSGQIQALNDSVDELKARLAKVTKQLEDMQAAQQTLSTAQAQQQAQQQAPPPDVLYNNALRDYNAAKYDLATQEFSDYIKFYPNTDLAGNSHFYLADIEFRQGNYEAAVKDYDQVLQDFPTGNKAPAAQLKKAFALIELGQKDDGIAELRHLIQRYPKSNEALQAKERLRKLGVSATAARKGQ
ncbi:MAG: tol-pal system protein YbgF [Acidobacteria bacterium]|nr:tol-pal system protein YbgF [Acidobacteriota bacterium]